MDTCRICHERPAHLMRHDHENFEVLGVCGGCLRQHYDRTKPAGQRFDENFARTLMEEPKCEPLGIA